jgi:hypothetical protein
VDIVAKILVLLDNMIYNVYMTYADHRVHTIEYCSDTIEVKPPIGDITMWQAIKAKAITDITRTMLTGMPPGAFLQEEILEDSSEGGKKVVGIRYTRQQDTANMEGIAYNMRLVLEHIGAEGDVGEKVLAE